MPEHANVTLNRRRFVEQAGLLQRGGAHQHERADD